MKKVLFSILTLILVVAMGMGIASADPGEDWPMFHHDLALSGYSTSEAPDNDSILWIYDTGAPIASSPAIVDGKLYIGALNGKFYALDANSGSLLWTFTATGPIHSSPAVADGNVYFLDESGWVYALDGATGAVKWSILAGNGSWDWSSPAVHDGSLFIATSNGFVHSLDAGTGAINWSTNVGGQPDGMIAVANGKVFSGTHNFNNSAPTLVALNEADGTIAWIYDYYLNHNGVVGMINSNGVAVVDGDDDGDLEVYFGVYNWGGISEQAVCLDEATGAEVWTADIGGNSTSTPAVHDGTVFIGSDDYKVYALDAGTGIEKWTFLTGGQVWAAPAVADGKVFVGSWDHIFYALDEEDGTLVWSYYTGASRMMGSPAVACGKVFFGNENGKIYAFGSNVALDIKPLSCPNPLNVKSRGVLPVAILGTEDFDVTQVDPGSVLLEGVAPLRWSLEDVATPFEPFTCKEDCLDCTDKGPDAYLDLTLKFSTEEIVDALGDVSDGECLVLTLTGNLKEEFEGKPIAGEDVVVILKKEK